MPTSCPAQGLNLCPHSSDLDPANRSANISFELFNTIEGCTWIAMGIVCCILLRKLRPPYAKLSMVAGVVLVLFGFSDFCEVLFGSFLEPGMMWLFVWKIAGVASLVSIIVWYLLLRWRDSDDDAGRANAFRLSKRARMVLAILLLPIAYVGSYVALAAAGSWHWSQTGKLRYEGGLSVTDVQRWHPAYARWEPFRDIYGTETFRANPAGHFYSPLIRLDRYWFHHDQEIFPSAKPTTHEN